MNRTAFISTLSAYFMFALMYGTAIAQPPATKDYLQANKDYLQDCSECHGVDGKGTSSGKSTAVGHVSVDFTRISQRNGGEFPYQKVYDAIDGRRRIGAHLRHNMPRWGTRYSIDEEAAQSAISPENRIRAHLKAEHDTRERISAMVDFIEAMQEK